MARDKRRERETVRRDLDALIGRMNAATTVEELNAAVSREEVEALPEAERQELLDRGHSMYLGLSALKYREPPARSSGD